MSSDSIRGRLSTGECRWVVRVHDASLEERARLSHAGYDGREVTIPAAKRGMACYGVKKKTNLSM
jgi:hypothetical protein